MTDNNDFELRLRARLREAAEPAPTHLRARIIRIPEEEVPISLGRQLPTAWRSLAVLRFAPVALAAAAVVVIALVGIGLVVRPTNVGPPASSIGRSAPAASPTEGEPVSVWPGYPQNEPGLYSWDGDRDWMHNGYGSGDVEITVTALRAGDLTGAEGTPVTVAGHAGIYQLIDWGRVVPLTEKWLFEVEQTLISIELTAKSGTSPSDLAEAHAIIASMWTEPHDNDLGFRLVFRLVTDDWDSG